MAHFAELDENNFVRQVIVVNNSELLDDNGNESEARGITFCQTLLGGKWIQTSYNSSFRANFAGIESFYNSKLDAFSTPKPYPSWILDEETNTFVAPVNKPDSGMWLWDESVVNWVEYNGA
jgi:hypothetical protein